MASDSRPAGLVGALDIGSNTIRLMVASPNGPLLETVLDDSRFVRLGKGVNASGRLDPDREAAAIAAISELMAEAKDRGVNSVRVVATSAVRDAANRQEFVDKARKELGVDVEILSGEAEARLTYLGATLGMSHDGRVIVCDIGGGSVELIDAEAGTILWARSLQLGCGRLTELFVHGDPPTAEERSAIAARFTEAMRSLPPANPELVVFTGGTASHVAYLTGRETMTSEILLADVQRLEDIVYSLPASEVSSRYTVKPERAEVLPAGITSLLAVAHYYDVDPVRITRGGIREGVIIDTLQSMGRWS